MPRMCRRGSDGMRPISAQAPMFFHVQWSSQVRFGVLNAGNFGVSQSRKRTFIWAAAPDDLLPDWPRLLHIFRSPQLSINLPGNVRVLVSPILVVGLAMSFISWCKMAICLSSASFQGEVVQLKVRAVPRRVQSSWCTSPNCFAVFSSATDGGCPSAKCDC